MSGSVVCLALRLCLLRRSMRVALTRAGLPPPPLRCLRFAARFLADGVRAARSVSAVSRKFAAPSCGKPRFALVACPRSAASPAASRSCFLFGISPPFLSRALLVPAPLPRGRLRPRAWLSLCPRPLRGLAGRGAPASSPRVWCAGCCPRSLKRCQGGGSALPLAGAIIAPLFSWLFARAVQVSLLSYGGGLSSLRSSTPAASSKWLNPCKKNNRQYLCRLNKTSFILYNCTKFFVCCQVSFSCN